MRPNEVRTLRGPVLRRGDETSRRIGGYALKFNRLSQNLGGFVERIDPGFPAKSEADGWPGVMARWNHEDAYLLGTTAGETLRLVVDGTGVDYEVDLPTARGDLLELVARGDVTQSSFAFQLIEDDWGLTDDGFPMRTLLSGRIVDVAPANAPAYLDTSTGLRTLAAKFHAEESEVRALADAGDLLRLFRRTDTTPTDSPPDPAAESTDPGGVQSLRRRLELSR